MSEENKNVVLLQSGDEKKPSRWSFRRYGKGIAFGKWWVIGTTAVVAAVGFLGTRFILNPMRESVSSSFSYENIAIEKKSNGDLVYLDGTRFSYANLVTRANLQAVKDSDPKFAAVNVDSLLDTIQISVPKEETPSTGPTIYTITARLSPLKDLTLARQYLGAVIESANKKATEIALKQGVDDVFPATFDKLAYKDQIDVVAKQKTLIADELAKLGEQFPSNAAVDASGTTLAKLTSDFNYAFMADGVDAVTALQDSYRANHWAKYSDETIDSVIAQMEETAKGYIERLRNGVEEIAVKQAAIDDFKASSSYATTDSEYIRTINKYTTEIAALKEERVDYLRELEFFGYDVDEFRATPTYEKIATIALSNPEGSLLRLKAIKDGTADAATLAWGASSKAFASKINAVKSLMTGEEGAIEDVSSAMRYLYTNSLSTVSYYDADVVKFSGHMNNAIGIAAGAVIGFVVSSFVVAAVYINKIDPTEQALADKEKEEGAKAK